MRHAATTLQAGDVPRFPPVRRDLSFVLDEAVPHAAVASAIREAGGDLVASCILFDVHTGPPLPAGRRAWRSRSSSAIPPARSNATRPTRRSTASAPGSRRTFGASSATEAAKRARGLPYRLRADGASLPLRRRPLPAELIGLLELSGKVKADPDAYADRLRGRSVALVFEKPSTRTRVSFEVGVAELGAHPLVISSTDLQLGRGETIEDTGRVLSRYVDAIVLRTFEQERLELLASASSVSVVNSLSDFEHPCQALADLFTIRERLGGPEGRTLAYFGDGNNVAHSLLLAGAKVGMKVRVATPPGFEPIPQVVKRATEIAMETGGTVDLLHDPGRRGRRRRRPLHRRLGEHGPGGRGGRARAGVPRVPARPEARRPRRSGTRS